MRYFRLVLFGLSLLALSTLRGTEASYSLLHTVLNPGSEAGARFGESVAWVDGNLVVGAPGDQNSGKVYVFDGATGALTLTVPNPAPGCCGDDFGQSVAALGDDIIIGAPRWVESGSGYVGRAYLVDGATGAVLRTFSNPTPADQEKFGHSVAVMGDDVLIGAYGDDAGAIDNTGAAYIFDAATGVLLHTLSNPDADANDYFGWAVASAGGNVISGAPHDDPGSVVDAGSVYVFDGTTGLLQEAIPNPAAVGNDQFGHAVAGVAGDVIVGSPFDNAGGFSNAGSVEIFDAVTGNVKLSVPNPDPGIGDQFGASVAIAQGILLAGAPQDSFPGAPAAAESSTCST